MILGCLLSIGASGQRVDFADTYRITGEGDEPPPGYVPPLISNGSLSMLIDHRGGQMQKRYVQMMPSIYWAGRRYNDHSDSRTHRYDELVPFGHFNQDIKINGKPSGDPQKWSQVLDIQGAKTICENNYAGLLSVETTVFTPLDRDLIVIHQRIKACSRQVQNTELSLNYQLTPPGGSNVKPRRMVSKSSWNEKGKNAEVLYRIDGYRAYEGIISLFSDHRAYAELDKQKIRLNVTLDFSSDSVKEMTFYILFRDVITNADFKTASKNGQADILKMGYVRLLASHEKAWQSYYNESFVHLPNLQMEAVYNTAQYHLRSNATQWSFPVGIFPTHWDGKYFAWDEMFCFQALASSNHLALSRRVPDFRYTGLAVANKRVSHYENSGKFGARFPWEALEDGSESTPQGFWMDHVFHMANVSQSSWLQYLYTLDTAYLRSTGYPVMRECARFYASHMIYQNPDGSMFVGKCTDLERLGPAVQNPFMTACGVIYTLETAARASHILNVNLEEAAKWNEIAEKLRASLPQENGRYVPYLGCQEESVASLGGLFPYPLFHADNKLQKNAAYHFLKNANSAGNMYPVGQGISAWYAGWLAAALDLLGDRKGPAALLADAAAGAGLFSELFEINEPKVKMHPWFSTASGNYVYALNQLLVQSDTNQIIIAPAVPDNWNDFSFKLACQGNIVITVSVKGGKLVMTDLVSASTEKLHRTILIPKRLFDRERLNHQQITAMKDLGDLVQITVDFSKSAKLFSPI